MATQDAGPTQATVLRKRLVDLPEGTFRVAVVKGAPAGASIELDGSSPSRILVGTSPVCDLRIEDPHVSRRHLALELRGARLRATDLGSTNGTFVGPLAVLDVWLSGGESLVIGATVLSVERHEGGKNQPVAPGTSFGRVIGASRAMRRLYPLCQKLAASSIPVVIEGETGTGKEVLAEALHEEGPRASKPFVVFDCTAVPPNLVESELFGHEKGAFTGAVALRRGVFEQAHGGTLLIDEIGDLEPSLQPKLLRALERGEVRRVGGDRFLKVDVRILAATRRDLDREVEQGRFRDDLFHRLTVGRIQLPPLRERTGDIELLGAHIYRQVGGEGEPPPELMARLARGAFPGNVRELRNAVARAVALGDSAPALAEADDGAAGLDDVVDRAARSGLPLAEARARVVDAFERRYLDAVLAQHGGVVTRAAAASGIARRHFQRLRARSRDA